MKKLILLSGIFIASSVFAMEMDQNNIKKDDRCSLKNFQLIW